MTQPYGQQPGQQPGGYPQAPGYQQGMGGMPAAPQEYSQGPIARPGSVTAAAVLAYIQAGITTITTILLLLGLGSAGSDADPLAWVAAIVQLGGIITLIWGGVVIMGGKSRNILIVGVVLEFLACLYWLISAAIIDTDGSEAIDYGKGVLIGAAIFFAIMPAIAMIMALGSSTTQFLQSRRA